MDPYFFLLVMVAVFAYGIQIPLLTAYARQIDGLTVTIYRNLSLGITMLPVLLFVSLEQITAIANYLPHIIAASGIGAAAFILNLTGATYLPLGVANSLRQSTNILGAIVLGVLFFQEYLSPLQLVLIVLLLCGTIALSLSRPSVAHLEKQNVRLGLLISMTAGIGYACSFLLFSYVARDVSPLVAGYTLELFVGIFALMFGVGRYIALRTPIPRLPVGTVFRIAAISLLAIAGTIAYGYAVHFGPYALAAALVSTTGVIALIAGRFFFGEKLTRRQIGIILFVIATVMALEFFR